MTPSPTREKSRTRQTFENVLVSQEARQRLSDQAEAISTQVDDAFHRIRDVGHTAVHQATHLFAAIGILAGGFQGLELVTGTGGSAERAISSLIFSIGALKLGQFVDRKRGEHRQDYELRRAQRPERPTLDDLSARPQAAHAAHPGWVVDPEGHVVRGPGVDPRLPDIEAWPLRSDFDADLDSHARGLAEPSVSADDAPTETIERPGHDLWGDL